MDARPMGMAAFGHTNWLWGSQKQQLGSIWAASSEGGCSRGGGGAGPSPRPARGPWMHEVQCNYIHGISLMPRLKLTNRTIIIMLARSGEKFGIVNDSQ